MTATTFDQVRPITQISNAARFGAGVASSLLSTALLVLAFPPYNVWPLAFFAFVPAFIAGYFFLPRQWAGLGSAISVGGWLGWVGLAGLVVFNVAINRKQKAGSK